MYFCFIMQVCFITNKITGSKHEQAIFHILAFRNKGGTLQVVRIKGIVK